jgi:purine-binding chemotaxis protein CheW
VIARSAAELREAFDRSFAEPSRPRRAQAVDLLAIRVVGDPYALLLGGIAGLFVDKPLARLPVTRPGFLGLAGFRGNSVPVYDLRAMLGYAGGLAPPRWLAVLSAATVALAFDAFEGRLRLPSDSITQPGEHAAPREHVRALAAAGDGVLRPLVDLDSALAAIRRHLSSKDSATQQPRKP